MIRTAIVVAVVALILGATTVALSFQDQASIEVAIDLNTDGNSGTAVGAIDSCRSVSVGDTFDIDVVVKGVPVMPSLPPGAAGAPGAGIAGFGFNLHYNPAVMDITAADNTLMLGADSPFQIIQANYVANGSANPFPATSGDMRVDFVDLSSNYESGDGVLSRFTIKATGVGRSDLTLDDELGESPVPDVLVSDSSNYLVSPLRNATITAGQPCDSPPTPIVATGAATASPSPSPASAVTPAPSVVPVGNTHLTIDTVTTGNEATKVGQIDTCGQASSGETFLVDVVIQGVTNLLAWELPVSFDPAILRVDGRNVKLFQAGNQGSSVIDTSNQTPNGTGIYITGAVDTADPPAPDSGDGVLVRLTFTAVGTGTSKLSLDPVDLNADHTSDKGVFLRNVDNAIIGDTNGDSFFDGPASGAEIRVGADCPSGAQVVSAASSGPATDSGSSNSWAWIVVAAGAVVVVTGAAAGLLRWRRRRIAP